MNKLHKPLFSLSVAFLFTLSSLSAVQTDPVGYTTLTGDTGGYVVTLPLAKSAVFEGTVNAVGTTVLNFDSTVPTLAGANYVQVMDGVLVGAVVDLSLIHI